MEVEPSVGELITTEHEPVPPWVAQLLGPTNVAVAPPAFVSEKVITIPFGAFTGPVHGSTFTRAVSVWFDPIGVVACKAESSMLASPTVNGSHSPSQPGYAASAV